MIYVIDRFIIYIKINKAIEMNRKDRNFRKEINSIIKENRMFKEENSVIQEEIKILKKQLQLIDNNLTKQLADKYKKNKNFEDSNLNKKLKELTEANKWLTEKVEKDEEESNTTFIEVNLVESSVMVDGNYTSSRLIGGLTEIIDYQVSE